MCNSRSCFSSTGDGASVSRHRARWVLGQALTPQVSVAADPRYVPLGAPLWLDTRVPTPFARLMVAQDTGGAIKGANRLDIFWGAGADARKTAGGLSTTGTTMLLLPPAAAARLTENGPQARR